MNSQIKNGLVVAAIVGLVSYGMKQYLATRGQGKYTQQDAMLDFDPTLYEF